MKKQKNIFTTRHAVATESRQEIKGHKPAVIWLTGLSGSGKTTLGNKLETELNAAGIHTYLLDGDHLRSGLCADLGFTEDDRVENMRRVAEVSKLMFSAGLVVISAFISPFRNERMKIRSMFPDLSFFEIYLNCPLAICEQRDVKGLYRRARAGEIENFTGISSPYEHPENPELELRTDLQDEQACLDALIMKLLPSIKSGNEHSASDL